MPQGVAERRQNGGDGDWTRHQDQKDRDCEADQRHLWERGRVDQQSQGEEQDDLHEPGDAIEEAHQADFMDNGAVPHNQAHEVDGQEAIATRGFRSGEGGDHEAKGQDGVEAVDVQLDLAQGESGEFA